MEGGILLLRRRSAAAAISAGSTTTTTEGATSIVVVAIHGRAAGRWTLAALLASLDGDARGMITGADADTALATLVHGKRSSDGLASSFNSGEFEESASLRTVDVKVLDGTEALSKGTPEQSIWYVLSNTLQNEYSAS